MSSNIRENSLSISFFIELCVAILVGVVFLNFLIGITFKYFETHNLFGHNKLLDFYYHIPPPKVKTLTLEQKDISNFANFLSSNNSNISEYLSENYIISLVNKYHKSNYALDIKQYLGINNVEKKVYFMKNYNSYYSIYLIVGKSKLYLDIYVSKENGKYLITDIKPVEV